MRLMLDCAICRCSAEADDLTPAQAEFLIDAWVRAHQHTAAERQAFTVTIARLSRDGGADE